MDQQPINLHQDVIDRCLTGSREAQYQLYKLYSKGMFNICLRMVNDRDDADDILQDSFISAFRNLKSYRADAPFGAWMKRIVVNKSITFIKKSRGMMVPLEDNLAEVADDNSHDFSEDQLRVNRIREGIKLLPDGFRTVLTMYLLEGFDHKEISDVLGISESTSKSQYLRAKKKLSSIMQDQVKYG